MSQARHQSRAGPGEEGLSDTLCQDCEGLCESGFRPFPFLLKDDYQGFLRSARRCSLCNLMVVSLRRAYDQFDHDHNRLSGFSEQHVGYNDDGATDTRSAKRKRATFQLSALGIPPNHVDVMAGMMYKKERILTKSRILVFSPPGKNGDSSSLIQTDIALQTLIHVSMRTRSIGSYGDGLRKRTCCYPRLASRATL